MLEKIKKYDTAIVIGIVACAILGYTLALNITAGDEIWNFNNVYKFSRGLVLYKDINIIITPLFVWIGSLFLSLLGNNLLAFRINNLVIGVIFFTEMYLLFKHLFKRKMPAYLAFAVLFTANRGLIVSGANYNMLAAIFFLLGVFLLLKAKELNWKVSLGQGILLFCIFLSKQNMAVFYAIGLFFLDLWIIKDKKKAILQFLIQMLTFVIGLGFFFLYLYANGILEGFFSYAVLGLKEFGQENLVGEWNPIIFIIGLLAVTITVALACLKNPKIQIKEEVKENIKKLICFAIPMCFIAFPIMNQYHIQLGLTLCYILLVYMLYEIILKEFIGKGKLLKVVSIIFTLYLVGSSFFFTIEWWKMINDSSYPFDKENPFYGGNPVDIREELEEVTAYIENSDKEVIVFSQDAALYSIWFGTSHGAMDLPFLGNMGKDGEERMLQEIASLKDKRILIRKDDVHYQESQKIREYIQENFKQVGTINKYLIYDTTE